MVQRVRNPLNQSPNQLTIGGMVLIEGLNISMRGSKEDEVGIFYENLNDGTVLRIPMESIFPNTPCSTCAAYRYLHRESTKLGRKVVSAQIRPSFIY